MQGNSKLQGFQKDQFNETPLCRRRKRYSQHFAFFVLSIVVLYIYASDLFTSIIYCDYGALYISIGKDSCTGDSGGPLISRQGEEEPMYLKGIVSFGARRCGEKGIPGVYTKVSEYIRWISKHISR